jgi:hypothetical protein
MVLAMYGVPGATQILEECAIIRVGIVRLRPFWRKPMSFGSADERMILGAPMP